MTDKPLDVTVKMGGQEFKVVDYSYDPDSLQFRCTLEDGSEYQFDGAYFSDMRLHHNDENVVSEMGRVQFVDPIQEKEDDD